MNVDPLRPEASASYLVSGGTSGIGRAAAVALTAAGNRVWVLGTRDETVTSTIAEYGLAGGSVCDVTEQEQVEAAVASAVAAIGTLDGVFVNAGIDGQGVPATDVEADFFRRVLDVNVIGAFQLAKAALPHLAPRGALLFNASVNGLRPEANYLDYNASKAAVISLSQTLALELAHRGFRINCICPGYFPTRMTEQFLADPAVATDALKFIPVGRVGELDEIANLVSYLLGPAPGFLTGAVIPIDGGRTVL